MNRKALTKRNLDDRQIAALNELRELVVAKIEAGYSEIDEWLRDGDPDDIAYALELVESVVSVLERPLPLSDKQHLLEGLWIEVERDMAEDYAEAASCAAQFWSAPNKYANRRGE